MGVMKRLRTDQQLGYRIRQDVLDWANGIDREAITARKQAEYRENLVREIRERQAAPASVPVKPRPDETPLRVKSIPKANTPESQGGLF